MNKRALLIGINDYSRTGTLGDLRFARQDAQSVAEALKSYYGFDDSEITLMTCESQGELCPATPYSVTDQLVPELFPNELDLFLFGFWGHGIWENKNRYMCLMSTRRSALSQSSLALSNILDRINRLPIRNACLIFDCCQNTAGERSVDQYMKPEEQEQMEQAARNLARDIGLRRQSAAVSAPTGPVPCVAILNSCKQGQVAFEWDDRRHGIFTAHLLDAMEKQYRTVNDWVSYLDNRVPQTSLELGKSRQTPFYCLEGAIELPVAEAAALPVPPTDSISELSVDWSEALLLLMSMFQKTGALYENAEAAGMFVRYNSRLEELRNQYLNCRLDEKAVYRDTLIAANQIGAWIRANSWLFEGRAQVFVSYLWFSWVQYANAHGLEALTHALNPRL